MKTLFTTLLTMGVLAFGSAANAVTVTPDSPLLVTTGLDTSNAIITAYIEDTFNVDHVYKQDGDDVVDGVTVVGTESGTFAGSYSTVFSNTPTDPSAAEITYDGGDSIYCGTCYLLVKDGAQDPAWYLFNLNAWDGVEALSLSGFWEGSGAISHVSLYAGNGGERGICNPTIEDCGDVPAVPIPAAAWLFGSGLIGLVGVARRKETTC